MVMMVSLLSEIPGQGNAPNQDFLESAGEASPK